MIIDITVLQKWICIHTGILPKNIYMIHQKYNGFPKVSRYEILFVYKVPTLQYVMIEEKNITEMFDMIDTICNTIDDELSEEHLT